MTYHPYHSLGWITTVISIASSVIAAGEQTNWWGSGHNEQAALEKMVRDLANNPNWKSGRFDQRYQPVLGNMAKLPNDAFDEVGVALQESIDSIGDSGDRVAQRYKKAYTLYLQVWEKIKAQRIAAGEKNAGISMASFGPVSVGIVGFGLAATAMYFTIKHSRS